MMRIKNREPSLSFLLSCTPRRFDRLAGVGLREGLHSLLFGVAATTCVSDYFLQVMTAPSIMKMKAPAWDCDA